MIVTLDVGTTACRATLFDEDAHPRSFAYKEYQNITPTPTTVEQDPNVWVAYLFKCMKECIRKSKRSPRDIRALVVASQRATIIPVNKNGKPLSNAILWLDKRSLKECEFISSKITPQTIYRKTGLRVDPYFSASKILWIRKHLPHVYKETFKFLTVHDYVIHALSGEMLTDETQASRTQLFNIDRRSWDNEILGTLGIDRDKLPDDVPTGSIVGELNQRVAAETGLPGKIPVLAGGGDQQLAAMGLGLVSQGRVGVITGAGSFILAHTGKSIRDERMRVLCTVSAIPNAWLLEAGIFTTGSIYKWFGDNLGREEALLAKKLRKSTYEIMDMEAATNRKKQPSRIVMLPHFAGSAAPYWNPLAKGVIFNLTLATTKSDLIAALLESICLELKKNLLVFEEVLGKRVREVYIGGGASRSKYFNGIQANVFGKPVVTLSTPEAVSLGAAMLALTKLGRYKHLNDCARRLIRVKSRTDPNPKSTEQYERLLELNEAVYETLNRNGLYRRVSELS